MAKNPAVESYERPLRVPPEFHVDPRGIRGPIVWERRIAGSTKETLADKADRMVYTSQ
jgi:hypothetical protein